VQSDVDKTNQSYYGESKLYYLTTDGVHEGLVPLRKFLFLLKEEPMPGSKKSIRMITIYFIF
jgi:uncharacterized protein with WD repeat